MKTLKKICLGGGVFLLTLSLAILGVCLIVIPSHAAANNNQNTLNAETYVQDGVEYETIYIPGDNDLEASKVMFNGDKTKNYRYIMTGDWDWVKHELRSTNQIRGNNIILDLNGKVINGRNGDYYTSFNCNILEFTDTSATGGGSLNVTSVSSVKTVITSGNGKMYDIGWGTVKINLIIRGGNQNHLNCWGTGGIADNLGSLTVAPYMVASSATKYVPSHGTYAVSDSRFNVASGESATRDLTVGQLTSQTFTEGYYLWGRKADGTYEYTDIQYTNGEWLAYETVYLTADAAANKALFAERQSGNYRYVMTANWYLGGEVTNERVQIHGDNVILDLQGYEISMYGYVPAAGSYFEHYATNFELADSSPLQTGRVFATANEPSFAIYTNCKKFVFSGGTLETMMHNRATELEIVFCGGNYRPKVSGQQLYNRQGTVGTTNIIIPAYYDVTYNSSGIPTLVVASDAYAVSSSNLVAGVNNYEYGLAWDLNATALGRFAMPANQTYYLWGRKANGAYEYLNIVYRDGEWVRVDPEILVA